jgi:hypothetical protein
MQHLRIQNTGEVQEQAFTLLGASTKRNQNGKIGMFGSGNKYALAYFMRNNYDVKIFSGEQEIKIGKKPTIFGGMEFNILTVNGKETSITDSSGPDWLLWHSIREIYSNALDEGEIGFDVVNGFVPEAGKTQIYIELTDAVKTFIDNIRFYFSFDTTFVFKNTSGRILEKTGDKINLFRKGIRALDTETKSLYDYDIESIDINESRVLKYDSHGKSAIWQLICQCDSVHVLKNILKNIHNDVFENNEYLGYWTQYDSPFSEAWDKAIEGHFVAPKDIGGLVDDKIKSKTYFVPNVLYKRLIAKYGREISAIQFRDGACPFQEIEQDGFIQNTISKVVEFFDECSFPVEYDIEAVKMIHSRTSSSNRKYVHFEGRKVLIDISLFEDGLNRVAQGYIQGMALIKAEENNTSNGIETINALLVYMKKRNSINL